MDKNKIASTTMLFIVIVGTIVGFKTVFGNENTLVAVAGITAALSLLGTDYTINPIKNTIYFVSLEVGIGVLTYIASVNAFLGFIITFISIFYILYSFTYNTKKPTYVAFTLGYFFMLYTPVTFDLLPRRLIGLASCGLLIMIMQMIVNRNKLKKEAQHGIKSSIKYISEEIDLILSGDKSIEKINNVTYNNLKNILESIYKRIDSKIKLPTNIMQYLFISQYLERINLVLNRVKMYGKEDEYNTVIIEVQKILVRLNLFIEGNLCLKELIVGLENALKDIEQSKKMHYLNFELYQCIETLRDDLGYKEDYVQKMDENYISSKVIYGLNNLKNNINRDSLKFTFAFRGALITSLGVFIVSLFNLQYGKWLVFSLISIVQPYFEASKTKGKDRIIGTVIGLLIFEILFSLVPSMAGRTFIILLVGYISNYLTEYRYQMICTTVSALGAAAMIDTVNYVFFNRMIFVIVGTLIALYASKIILPYRISDVIKREIKSSLELNKSIVDKLYDIGVKKLKINDDFKEILTINEFLNNKISNNSNTLSLSSIDEFLYSQRIFMYEIRSLINNFKTYVKNNMYSLKLIYDIELILNKDITEQDVTECFNNLQNNDDKLILINVVEIKYSMMKASRIYNNILNEI
ncbi:FUSC family protein [Clostridium ihumii]|uniref:FUSC family protein n=1 Tax=Clostridium ihumii TaxID=1470356 RepID=UPI000590404C|nr:FUSC family protein [Clostridium ihumii]